jgi:hypothetical protein
MTIFRRGQIVFFFLTQIQIVAVLVNQFQDPPRYETSGGWCSPEKITGQCGYYHKLNKHVILMLGRVGTRAGQWCHGCHTKY